MNRKNFIKNVGLTIGAASILKLEDLRGMGIKDKNMFYESAGKIPIVNQSDVIVCGAGPAGIAAALSAARSGVKTTLIETHGCLGGVWTAGLLTWIFDMDKPGIAREITRRLDEYDARRRWEKPDKYIYEPEVMKLLLEEMCQEAGVNIRLFTRVVAAPVNKDKKIECIVTESKSGREAWKAGVYIDTTGDGDLAALAGNGFDYGHPKTGQTQPMTLMGLINVKSAKDLAKFLAYYPERRNMGFERWSVPMFLEEIRRAGVEPSYKAPTLFNVRDDIIAFMVNHEYGY
jgi:flavin-dependent dehydrogenase